MLKFAILKVNKKNTTMDIVIDRGEDWIFERLLDNARVAISAKKRLFRRKKKWTEEEIETIVGDAMAKVISEFKELTIKLP